MVSALRDGHLFVHRLQCEHSLLDECLREATQAMAATEDNSVDVDLALSQLRAELLRHFDTEARGGFLEDAACRAPRMAHWATLLEREQTDLQLQFDQVLLLCADSAEGISSQAVARFDAFKQALRNHIEAERRLLCDAFGICPD